MTRFVSLPLAIVALLLGCERKAGVPPPAPAKAPALVPIETSLPPVKAPAPPEPGRVELTFSGAFNAQVKGDGVECHEDGGFSVLSADVQGFNRPPEWSFINLLKSAHVNVGPDEKEQHYIVEGASAAPVRRGERFVVDLKLASTAVGEGVRVTGFVTCPSKATANEIPGPIAALLRRTALAEIRPFSTIDFGRAKDVRSVSAIVAKPAAEAALAKVRSKLPPGFAAFIGTTQWLGDEKHEGVELVIGPARDQFDIPRLAHSDAVNFGLATEALVKKLRQIHASTPIDIFHAETDTIEFRLLAPPANPKAFAKDIYEFCPDSVDQGVGTLEALEKAIVNDRRVYLWWD